MKKNIYKITDSQNINNAFMLVNEFQLHEFLITQIWYEIERLQNWQSNMSEDKMNEIFKDIKNKLKTYDYVIKKI